MRRGHFDSWLVAAVCFWMLALSPQAGARDEEVSARLTRQIDAVIAFFPPAGSKVPPETLADSLIDTKARQQLFRLEGLLRLYKRARPDLEKYRLKVKELEDGLGAYSFAADSVTFAKDKFKEQNRTQAPNAARQAEQNNVLQSLTHEKDSARGVFAKLVEKSTLASDLRTLRPLVVSRFAGWSASKEISYVSGELQRMLKIVKNGRFDFNNLELGIHEYRRRLRWFPVEVDSLDGLILVRDDPPGACPIPALEALAGSATAKHRYSNPALRFPAAHPCTISRCLLWQVVKTTNDLGHVKDEALGDASIAEALDNDNYVATKNTVTPQEIARAKAIRTELLSSKTLDALMTQLSSCK